nr:hypothetical protein [Tanacetum cinerariifolium]
MDEYKARQKAILELAVQFDNACTTKDDMRKAYKKCKDITQESRALIDTFLKEVSDKGYGINLSIYGKAAKIKEQIETFKLDRAEEETRMRSLPLDEPLKTFSVQILRLSSESDMHISNILESAREKVFASINKREELFKNYRAI